MLASLCLLATCLGQTSPTAPAAPTLAVPTGPSAPAVAEPLGGGSDSTKGGAALPDAPLPPSLTIDALDEELKGAAKAGRIKAAQERAKLEEERSKLRDMAAQIEKARHDLREETRAMEELTRKAKPTPSSGPLPAAHQSHGPVKRDSLTSLAKTLQGMKPVQAAILIEHLDSDLAVELFRLLRPSDAAPIVDKLKPEMAARLFDALAIHSDPPSGGPK